MNGIAPLNTKLVHVECAIDLYLKCVHTSGRLTIMTRGKTARKWLVTNHRMSLRPDRSLGGGGDAIFASVAESVAEDEICASPPGVGIERPTY